MIFSEQILRFYFIMVYFNILFYKIIDKIADKGYRGLLK
jgi:hypothetical protein